MKTILLLLFISGAIYGYSQSVTTYCYPSNTTYSTGRVDIYGKYDDRISVGEGVLSQDIRGWATFDVSSIPNNATVTALELRIYVYNASTSSNHDLDFKQLSVYPPNSTSTAKIIRDNIDNSTDYNATFSSEGTSIGFKTITLNSSAISYFNNTALSQNWFGVGMIEYGRDDDDCDIYGRTSSSYKPRLKVTYTIPRPDLVVQNLSVSPTTIQQGATTSISCTVRNSGNASSASCRVGYYLSTNTTWSTGDTYLGYDYVSSLGSGATSYESETVTIPSNITPGTYYLFFVADYQGSITESNENNNTGYRQVTITPRPPDLVVQNISVSPTTIQKGSTTNLSCTVKNNGTGSSASCRVGYYISTNTTWSTGDTYLGYDYVSSLSSGAISNESETVTIPSNISSGTYYLFFVADYQGIISESNESNNEGYRQVTIIDPPYLSLSTNTINVSSIAQNQSFSINSNTNWTVSDDANWLTVSPTNGSNNGTVTVSYSENTSTSQRTATITVSGTGVSSQTITVIQAGATYTLSVTPNSLNVNSSSGNKTFNINSNTNWTVNDDANWLTVSPASGSNNGTITVSYSENTSTSQRTATITVSGTGVSSQTITVIQAGVTNTLTVTPSNITINSNQGSTTFDISSNTNWNITENSDWITVNPTSGTNDATITVNYNENTSTLQRTATITISTTNAGTKTVTISQTGASEYLTVSTSFINIEHPAGSADFQIASNSSWTISTNADWLSLNKTNGSGDATITLYYLENTGGIRTASITISNSSTTETISVTQGSNGITSVNNSDLITVYPNPTKGTLFIKSDIRIHKIKIYSLQGSLLFNESYTPQINVSSLNEGIYLIKFYSRDNKLLKTKRIMISK